MESKFESFVPEEKKQRLLLETSAHRLQDQRLDTQIQWLSSLHLKDLIALARASKPWRMLVERYFLDIAKVKYRKSSNSFCDLAFMEGTICPVPWKVERLLGQHLNECKEYCLQHSRPILIVQQLLQWGRYLWGLHMRSPASQQVKYVDERADSKQPQILSVANLLWYGISITLTHSVLFKPNISIDFEQHQGRIKFDFDHFPDVKRIPFDFDIEDAERLTLDRIKTASANGYEIQHASLRLLLPTEEVRADSRITLLPPEGMPHLQRLPGGSGTRLRVRKWGDQISAYIFSFQKKGVGENAVFG